MQAKEHAGCAQKGECDDNFCLMEDLWSDNFIPAKPTKEPRVRDPDDVERQKKERERKILKGFFSTNSTSVAKCARKLLQNQTQSEDTSGEGSESSQLTDNDASDG